MIMAPGYFFVKKNSSQSARRGCYGRFSEWISEWISERCMYVTPIRLDQSNFLL